MLIMVTRSYPKLLNKSKKKIDVLTKPRLFFTAATALVTLIAIYIWRADAGPTQALGWDIYAHQTLYNELIKGNLYFLPSRISDTFLVDAYLPTFAVLVGLGKKLFPALTLPEYYSVLDTLHFGVTVFISVYLGWKLSRSRWIAFLTGVFGAFGFGSVVAQTAFYFVPQTLAATLVMLALLDWIESARKRALFWLGMAVSIHLVVALLGGMLLIVLSISRHLEIKNTFKKLKKLRLDLSRQVWSAYILLILALGLGCLVNIDPFGTTESLQLNFALQQKLEYFLQWYGFTPILFFIGSAWVLKFGNKKLHRAVILALLIVGAVFLPLPYSLKLYTVGRYWVHLIMAVGLVTLLRSWQTKYSRILILGVVVLVQSTVFYFNQNLYKTALVYGEQSSTLSMVELEAARFLRRKYALDQQVILVSDPATQHILEPLTDINTQGGAFASFKTRELLDLVYPNDDPQEIKTKLFKVKDKLNAKQPDKVLFVVSGRFISWQNLPKEKRYDLSYNIWGARDLTLEALEYVRFLEKDPDFKTVYRNRAMVIFEL